MTVLRADNVKHTPEILQIVDILSSAWSWNILESGLDLQHSTMLWYAFAKNI